MTLFIKNTEEVEEIVLTSESAQTIYDLFKVGLNETELFTLHGVSFKDSNLVKAEYKLLEAEIISKVKGIFELTPLIPATEDNEEIPATYYILTTKTALIVSLSSDLLNVETVCSDVEDYYKDYEAGRTWGEFVNLVQEE